MVYQLKDQYTGDVIDTDIMTEAEALVRNMQQPLDSDYRWVPVQYDDSVADTLMAEQRR